MLRTLTSGRPASGAIGMTQWGLDTLFNPSKRHMDEEKQRLQSTREQIGDASGGKRVDLESGKVTIRRATGDEDDAAASASAATDEDDGADTARNRARARRRAARERHTAR